MADTPHKPLLKLRTFQLDQAHARGEDVVSGAEKKSAPPPIVAATIPAATPKIVVTTTKKIETKVSTPVEIAPPVPPSFHELKKQAHKKIEHIVAEETKPVSKTVTVRDKGTAPLPRSFSSEATVITSAKKNEFRLFPAIASSLKTWFASFGSKDTVPKFTVTATEKRERVIQKATTKSGAVFTTGTDSLKQELTKNREGSKLEPSHPLHIQWTLQTEPGYTLLEEPDRFPALPATPTVTIEYKKRTIPPPEIISPQIIEPKRVFVPPSDESSFGESDRWESGGVTAADSPYAPTPLPSVARRPESEPPARPTWEVPQHIKPTVPTQHAPLPESAAPTMPAPMSVPIPIPQPLPAAAPVEMPPPLSITKPGTSIPNKPNPKTSYLKSGLSQLFRFDTTVTTVVIVGSIVSFVMVFLIVRTFVGIVTTTETSNTPTTSATAPLTPSGNVVDVSISALSYDALMSAFTSQSRPASGVVEFRMQDANGTPLGGNQLWDIFDFSSDPNLSRSIQTAHIGYAEGDRFLVMNVTDPLTVFGALLSWESRMTEELAVLFEDVPRAGGSFTDETVAGSDVRVRKDGDGAMLIYGFTGSNTVVITESYAAYEAAGSK